jgi:hypothetical protein
MWGFLFVTPIYRSLRRPVQLQRYYQLLSFGNEPVLRKLTAVLNDEVCDATEASL